MRLELRLPVVKPEEICAPKVCRYAKCGGRHLRLHQVLTKAVRDTVVEQVTVRRYQCLRCRRTFRVYPTGVQPAATSQRVKGLAVMLYVLGLSYGAVALALEALGVYLCKSQVYVDGAGGGQAGAGFHGFRAFPGRPPSTGRLPFRAGDYQR